MSTPTDPTQESRRAMTSMLSPDIDQRRPNQFDPSPRHDKLGWTGVMIGFGAFFVIGVVIGSVFMILVGILGIPWCIYGVRQVDKENEAAEDLDRQRLAHYQSQDQTRLQQREVAVSAIKDYEIAQVHSATTRDVATTQANAQVQTAQIQANAQMHTANVQADAQVQSAHYQALAAAGERQFQEDVMRLEASLSHTEAQRIREFNALEAQLDRDHEVTKLTKRLEHELRLWEEQITADVSLTPQMRQAELDAFKLEQAAFEAINAEENEDTKLRLLKLYDKRMGARRGS